LKKQSKNEKTTHTKQEHTHVKKNSKDNYDCFVKPTRRPEENDCI